MLVTLAGLLSLAVAARCQTNQTDGPTYDLGAVTPKTLLDPAPIALALVHFARAITDTFSMEFSEIFQLATNFTNVPQCVRNLNDASGQLTKVRIGGDSACVRKRLIESPDLIADNPQGCVVLRPRTILAFELSGYPQQANQLHLWPKVNYDVSFYDAMGSLESNFSSAFLS